MTRERVPVERVPSAETAADRLESPRFGGSDDVEPSSGSLDRSQFVVERD